MTTSVPERGAARPPHVLHVELVVINCCVLLDGVQLGDGAVSKNVAADSLMPLVWVVLNASEVHEGVEVDIVL